MRLRGGRLCERVAEWMRIVTHLRGEPNLFTDELKEIDGLLRPGDIILMTGTSLESQLLARSQKLIYGNARSSHVAIVHADFVCIDAIPNAGTTNRIISDVLADATDDWRVLRSKKVGPENTDLVMRACAFYLAQPYKIWPSRKPLESYAYCSELARKVFGKCGITSNGIPNKKLITPAHFDKLADEAHPLWTDVTETVRPAVEYSKKYPEILRAVAKIFISGLELNQKRFKERERQIALIQQNAKLGRLPVKTATRMVKEIRDCENNLNNTFWNTKH